MTKKGVLIQYANMLVEVNDLRRRIGVTEDQLKKMEEDGYKVRDSVKGGLGGRQVFKIEGFPSEDYSNKKTLLMSRKARLSAAELSLLELLNEVDDFIESIEKPDLRIMFRLYYIDNLPWYRVALKLNELFKDRKVKYTEDSCKKRNSRYFKDI